MPTRDEELSRRGFLERSAALAVLPALGACATSGRGPRDSTTIDPRGGAVSAQVDANYFETQFGVTAEMIRQVLAEAMSRGGDFADLYFQHKTATSVGVQDHIVNRASTSVSLGVGIRVVKGDQTGYAFTEQLTLERMRAAAKTAAAIANETSAHAPVELVPTALKPYYDTEYDWGAVGVDRITPILSGLDAQTTAAHADVRRVSVGFGSSQSRILIVDSDGRMAFDNQPMTRLSLSVTMERGGERQSNSFHLSGREGLGFYSKARLDGFVADCVARTSILFEARKPPAGEMPVVLAAGSSGILLHEAIGHGMEADFNRIGTSIFSGRIGKKVAHENVTIVDSGVDPRFRGSINVDDEGNAPQVTTLVKDGILTSYLHDRISAKHYGVEPTGSGRRQSFRHQPLPRMRNTFMQAGPHAREEIIKSVDKGIYAISFTNGQVKIGPGDYTFYVKNGYLIEDGKLTAPIKDVNIIGNGPESLERVSMVGDDFEMDHGGWVCGKDGQRVPVSLGLPTIRVDAITVGGAA